MADPVDTTSAAAPSPAADPAPAGTSVLGNVGGAAPAAEPDAAATGDKPADGSAQPPAVVPESYEFTAPEGFAADEKAVDGLKGMAKDLGLTQEQFAKLSGFGIEQIKAATSAPQQAWQQTQDTWKAEIAADPELGLVDGKLSPAAGEHVARALEQFGNPALMEALALTGAGNNPAVVKAFVAIGKAIGAAKSLDVGRPASAAPRGNSFNEIASRMPYKQNAGA